jgi:hypothetical protein
MKSVYFFAFILLIVSASASNCTNFQGLDACVGNQTEYPPAIESRRWQTPPRGSSDWQPQYQDHSCLVGHARVIYASDHLSANVTVITLTSDPSASVTCAFGSAQHGPCSASFSSKFSASLQIQASPVSHSRQPPHPTPCSQFPSSLPSCARRPRRPAAASSTSTTSTSSGTGPPTFLQTETANL